MTRNKHTYLNPTMKKTAGQRSFLFLGPKLYNAIPQQIKSGIFCKGANFKSS